MIRRPPRSTLFPYRRSSDLNFWIGLIVWSVVIGIAVAGEREPLGLAHLTLVPMIALGITLVASRLAARDRKSTRLNSSQGYISYAVFCLKKKTHRVLSPSF